MHNPTRVLFQARPERSQRFDALGFERDEFAAARAPDRQRPSRLKVVCTPARVASSPPGPWRHDKAGEHEQIRSRQTLFGNLRQLRHSRQRGSTSALPQRLLAARFPCWRRLNRRPRSRTLRRRNIESLDALEPVPCVSTKRAWRDVMRHGTLAHGLSQSSSSSRSRLSPQRYQAAAICAR